MNAGTERRSLRRGALGLVAVLAAVFATATWAFEGEHRDGNCRHDPQQKVERLTDRLSLDDAQQEAILAILENQSASMKVIHEHMREVREETNGKIETQLTEEQLAAYRELSEHRHSRGHGRCKGKRERETES